MAYPTSVINIPTRNTGDLITADFFNTPNTEIVAIEQDLINGALRLSLIPNVDVTYNLGSASKRWLNFYSSALQALDVASRANYITVTSSITGSHPIFATAGTDAAPAFLFQPKAATSPTFRIDASSPWIDVKAYGAKGDGVADDTTSIQNAINAASAWSGLGGTPAIIYCPPGTYSFSVLTFSTQTVILRGAGPASTVLKKTATTGDCITVGTTAALSSYNQGIEDLTIDARLQTGGHGITIQTGAQQVTISRVRVYQPFARGIFVNGGQAIIRFCSIENFGDTGIYWAAGSNGGDATGNLISSPVSRLASAGISINSTSGVIITGDNIQLDDNVGRTARSIILNAVSQCTVAGNWIGGGPSINSGTGIYCSGGGSNNVITANLIFSFQDEGIRLDNTSFTTVSGNSLSAASTGNPFGIRETGTSNNNAIVGNTLQGTYQAGGTLVPLGTLSTWLANTAATFPANVGQGSLALGTSAPVTGATTGFPYIPSMAGIPGGVPTAITGYAAVVWDDTNKQFDVYSPGAAAWQKFSISSPTITLKKGSQTGTDYTTTSATYVDVDATNLAFTVTIPTGQKLAITTSVPHETDAVASSFFRLVDGTTAVAEAKVNNSASPATEASVVAFAVVIAGDGASHTIKLQFAGGGARIFNQAASTTTTPNNGFATIVFVMQTAS